MNNETAPRAGSVGFQGVDPSPRRVLGASAARPADPALDGEASLLAFCDAYFAPLMRAAQVDSEVPLAPAVAPPLAPLPASVLDGLAGVGLRPVGQPPAFSLPSGPARGLGARVWIGFDAEWEFARQGRNQLLSVQFHLIGPTGEARRQVIHVRGGAAVRERPRLSQALNDLLEAALEDGIVTEWPVEVVLCGFFTRADITVFADFKHLRPQLDGVGGSLVTIGRPAQVELPLSGAREQSLKRRYQAVVGDVYEPKWLNVRLVDASRLAPAGQSLAGLGQWLGIPKLELPAGHTKEAMARFQRDACPQFEAYGLRDAEIAVLYGLWVWWFAARHLGLGHRHLSTTISGLAVRVAERCIRLDGVALAVAFNDEVTSFTRWDTQRDRVRTQKKRLPKRIRRWLEPFLADAYLGGRNECFVYGPTERRRYYDPDLSGAYLSGLAYLFVLDYDRFFMSTRVDDFIGHVAGFALVEFAFPPETQRPCLPVVVEDRGLLFPLQGECLCTAPEIELARAMGATLTIQYGIVIPWMARQTVFDRSGQARPCEAGGMGVAWGFDQVTLPFPPPAQGDEGYRLFESFMQVMRSLRGVYRRKSLPFEFIKTLSCALYGKTGQGYKGKRVFGPRELASVVVGPSRVSEVAVAGLVCGFIRAVLGEILWKLPAEATLVSVTTDGFLVDVPLDQLDLSGPLCRRFQALVERVAPGSPMLENKHQVWQLFAGRTRLQVTTEADGAFPIVTAKGGIKPGPDVADENAFMVNLILNRTPGQKLAYESFISMRDQLVLNGDLQLERREMALNAEYDFKRRPVVASGRMVEVGDTGIAHLAFDTEPWVRVEEAALTRTLFDQWRKTHCLKTVDDLSDWEAFRGFRVANRQRRSVPEPGDRTAAPGAGRTGRCHLTQEEGYVGVAKRVFLAAYQKRLWGLAAADLSQRQLADWLTAQGYATSLSAVKNGTRVQPQAHVVPATSKVLAFLDVLKERFPGLECELFLIVEA
ncbi:hypothetical protein [Thiocystis violacea]|uniref:hypothetical protein n=1 Tax=Thiocystis violacea TaxID=13725 RepID=UPI001905968C|nr:hypothetical protein [Thiocystis violacea]